MAVRCGFGCERSPALQDAYHVMRFTAWICEKIVTVPRNRYVRHTQDAEDPNMLLLDRDPDGSCDLVVNGSEQIKADDDHWTRGQAGMITKHPGDHRPIWFGCEESSSDSEWLLVARDTMQTAACRSSVIFLGSDNPRRPLSKYPLLGNRLFLTDFDQNKADYYH